MKVFKIIDKIRYEVDRAKRVYPTLLRAGISEIFDFGVQAAMDLVDDVKHRVSHYRGTCDHLDPGGVRTAAPKRAKRNVSRSAKASAKSRRKKTAH